MSDTYRRYGAIKHALMQYFPSLSGHREAHFNTLAALICGLIGGQRAHLSSIADHAPAPRIQQESLIKRFSRWLANDTNSVDAWFLPVAQALLSNLSDQPLLIAIDGSVVGRGCITLMLSVVWNKRALPLCWLVVNGKKGHLPQALHCALLEQLEPLIPCNAKVVILGDAEFDGTDVQALITRFGWTYVLRTSPSLCLRLGSYQTYVDVLKPKRGEWFGVYGARLTQTAYGPVNVMAVWEEAYEDILYLITTMDEMTAALAAYRKRAHIETFFSDQKSRGFQMERSHLCNPERLSRLLMASCFAYVWVVYLGACAKGEEWQRLLHRRDRCDLSLFRLGMRLLARCLKEMIPLPVGLLVPQSSLTCSVR